MERLTAKNKANTPYNQKEYPYLAGADINEITNKLGKLEDIEEELGIPLEVIFKALLNGILDEDGRYHSKVRLSNKLGYIGLVDEEGYCWDTKKYLSKWWILGGEYDD